MVANNASYGVGLYTYVAAARLLKTNRRNVQRWCEGYLLPREGGYETKGPAVRSGRSIAGHINFRELIELRVVERFVTLGVRLSHIVDTAAVLERELGPCPLANARLQTDGRIILRRLPDHLIQPDVGQIVMDFVKAEWDNYGFDEDHLVNLWCPMGKDEPVLVDPSRQFGDPITLAGVPTDTVFRAFRAEKDFERVADWYQIPAQEVRAAVRFESDWMVAA